MKKLAKALFAILLIVIVVSAVLIFWQRDNINAVINGLKYSSEDLETKLDSEKEHLKREVEKYTSSEINDISLEDEQKLFKGEITMEEVSQKYNLPLNVLKEDESNSTQTSNDDEIEIIESMDDSEAIDLAVSMGVSKMYALKAKYVSKLGEVERAIYEEYTNLPKDKQNESSKKQIIAKNLNYVADLEQKCDDDVKAVLTSLEQELKKLNGDEEIIKVLNDAYKNEKELKKSYYLSLYSN